MDLEQLIEDKRVLPRLRIGADPALSRQVQNRLAACGLLDPPADGNFGPVSNWAFEQFMLRVGQDPKNLDAAGAEQLLAASSETTAFPLAAIPETGGSFAERIVRSLLSQRYWLCRHPDAVNIVYVEACDADGKRNANESNEFNDLRLLLRINRNGRSVIDGLWEATTEPGYYFTKVRHLDPDGAARIAFGQYKSWAVGPHPKNSKTAHEALVQVADVTVFRDLNEDYARLGDRPQTGTFGINQHWGYDMPKRDIGNASAGCLVGRTRSGHREFMSMCKADPRYSASGGYRFMSTVLDGALL